MGYRLKGITNASHIAHVLDLPMRGDDIKIKAVASLDDARDSCLIFAKKTDGLKNKPSNMAIISGIDTEHAGCATIQSKNPRLDFIRALDFLKENVGFVSEAYEPRVHSTVKIGKNVVIEGGVTIGEFCTIGHNVVIKAGTVIGKFCNIQSGVVIGEDGYGFERDNVGVPIRMVHLGGVTLGNNVHVGANTTICQGTLGPTIIENDVKIDNSVHIAHNCHIKARVMIVGAAEICGSVLVEEDAWIAPNVSIKQKVTIGKRAQVGLGAVVLSDVSEQMVVLGNPARPFHRLKSEK